MPGLALAGRIVSRFGNLHGLRIGALSSCASFALAGRARTWLDFSAAAVCGSFAMTSYSAQSALAMIEGKAVGFQQGELQAAGCRHGRIQARPHPAGEDLAPRRSEQPLGRSAGAALARLHKESD